MFKNLYRRLSKWFSRITSPISYNENYLTVSETAYMLLPDIFSRIHSSNFNTITINSYSKTLEEYNDLTIFILETIKKGNKPNVAFSEIYKISLPDFFLSKSGNYCRESDLIKTLQKNVEEIVERLISYEMKDSFSDSSMEYMYLKRLYDSSVDLVNVLYETQEKF